MNLVVKGGRTIDNKYRTFRSMIGYAKKYNQPKNNWFAEMIWRLFSSDLFTVEFSKKMYNKMGYVPFGGFPLTKANNQ